MNKRHAVVAVVILLFTLQTLAIIKSNSYRFEKTTDSEKCSNEIEKLKLCVENSNIIVNSGEPVNIKVFWANTSDADRRIGLRSTGYSITVKDENDKKLIPVFEQRFMERQERIQNSGDSTMTEEDIKALKRTVRFGSDRGLYAEANGIEKDEIRLTENMYDYDLTAKGHYYVTISKKVASLEKGEAIEFVIDDIEIQVK